MGCADNAQRFLICVLDPSDQTRRSCSEGRVDKGSKTVSFS